MERRKTTYKYLTINESITDSLSHFNFSANGHFHTIRDGVNKEHLSSLVRRFGDTANWLREQLVPANSPELHTCEKKVIQFRSSFIDELSSPTQQMFSLPNILSLSASSSHSLSSSPLSFLSVSWVTALQLMLTHDL